MLCKVFLLTTLICIGLANVTVLPTVWLKKQDKRLEKIRFFLKTLLVLVVLSYLFKNLSINYDYTKKFITLIFYMAKKSMVERERKRQRLVNRYSKKRALLKEQIKTASSLEEKLLLHRRLQKIPRNSASVRLHNRCLLTGRPKGYFRDFGLSRHMLREMAHQGLLPGVTKSSW